MLKNKDFSKREGNVSRETWGLRPAGQDVGWPKTARNAPPFSFRAIEKTALAAYWCGGYRRAGRPRPAVYRCAAFFGRMLSAPTRSQKNPVGAGITRPCRSAPQPGICTYSRRHFGSYVGTMLVRRTGLLRMSRAAANAAARRRRTERNRRRRLLARRKAKPLATNRYTAPQNKIFSFDRARPFSFLKENGVRGKARKKRAPGSGALLSLHN